MKETLLIVEIVVAALRLLRSSKLFFFLFVHSCYRVLFLQTNGFVLIVKVTLIFNVLEIFSFPLFFISYKHFKFSQDYKVV